MLHIKSLSATINNKEILSNIDLHIKTGEVHVIMGPNGAGKSTLANVIMGHRSYKVTQGDIIFEGEDIQELSVTQRARKGIFLSFQNPLEVLGVPLRSFLRTAKNTIDNTNLSVVKFERELKAQASKLNIDDQYLDRYLNYGFSGGEKKKSEILQMLVINPKLAILDETDSGLDIDAIKTVALGINLFKTANRSIVIITHNTAFLNRLKLDYVHILKSGTILKSGKEEIIEELSKYGFKNYE